MRFDLSWKIHATLRGWGGPDLLASYEIERRQVGDRNVGASRYASVGSANGVRSNHPNIPTPRRRAGHARQPCARRQCRAAQDERDDRCRIGLVAMSESPVIWEEPGGPEHCSGIQPTTWPAARGCRTSGCGRVLGARRDRRRYTLLRTGRIAPDTSGVERAMRSLDAPLDVLTIDGDAPRCVRL